MSNLYDHLTPGTEGYWPLVGARPDDLRDGDRLVEDGTVVGVVSNVRIDGPIVRFDLATDGLPTGPVSAMRIGRMARITIDRFGTHSTLANSVR